MNETISINHKLKMDLSRLIPKHAQIIEDKNDPNKVEIQWQIHKYIEKTSYRELRLKVEEQNDYFKIILCDDLIDYDNTASNEYQYYIKVNKNQYTNSMNIINKTINNIERNKHKPETFKLFEKNLLDLGFIIN